jgi:hypothetical protein
LTCRAAGAFILFSFGIHQHYLLLIPLSSMTKKPLIGITTYFVTDQELTGRRVRGTVGQDMVMSNLDYSRSIDQAGGIPVALPSLESPRAATDLVQHLDGLLLAGGEDIAPALFQQSPQPGLGAVIERRDRYEWALLAAALAKGIHLRHLPGLAVAQCLFRWQPLSGSRHLLQ